MRAEKPAINHSCHSNDLALPAFRAKIQHVLIYMHSTSGAQKVAVNRSRHQNDVAFPAFRAKIRSHAARMDCREICRTSRS